MSNSEWNGMNEAEFDALLQNSLPEPPPNDIAKAVTPWRHSMNRVLSGVALNVITLNFLALNYILPAIGIVLMLLGFRTLRRENGWFRRCLIITIIRAVSFYVILVLNATIIPSILYDLPILIYLSILNGALTLLLLFCLWRAFSAVKAKGGFSVSSGPLAALIVWYIVLAIIALLDVGEGLAGIVMVVLFVIIIRCLIKISKELDEAGYMIVAATVKMADKFIVGIIGLILFIGIACGYIFGGSYPMEWAVTKPSEQTEILEIKEQLIELGFPTEVLEDLTEADIMECQDAQRIAVNFMDYAVNDGRQVIETQGNTTSYYTVYDVEELRITGVAVQLTGESEVWKIFHHFRWMVDPGFYGTESLQIWPAYYTNDYWGEYSDVTGQVLCTLDGQNYAAGYYSLGSETYASNSIMLGEQTSTDIFAVFSMPRNSENQRGYISYSTVEMQDGWVLSSWANYTHQQSWLQYPALTAVQTRMSSGWNKEGVFLTVQDALQFYPSEDAIEIS